MNILQGRDWGEDTQDTSDDTDEKVLHET